VLNIAFEYLSSTRDTGDDRVAHNLLAVSDEQLRPDVPMVSRALALCGARHQEDHDDFTVVSNDPSGFHGDLEHHRSSEYAVRRSNFIGGDRALALHTLLAQEFTRSWNGTFRRPRDLWTADDAVPMQTSLLWVHEGLTSEWGQARAGPHRAPGQGRRCVSECCRR